MPQQRHLIELSTVDLTLLMSFVAFYIASTDMDIQALVLSSQFIRRHPQDFAALSDKLVAASESALQAEGRVS